MCQIIGISNIQGLTRDEISTLALTAKTLMSQSQKDGFGFAYSTTSRAKKKHTYYVEKYTNPHHFNGLGTVGFTKKHFEPIMDAVEVPMLSSGHSDAPTGPMIIHGRNATSDVNLLNTHPFRKKGWALVHNGVVDMPMLPEDFEEEPEKQYIELLNSRYSSCDSEWLLNTYAFGKGHLDWWDYVTGYAATLAISPDNRLIVAKDTKAMLYIAAIPELNNSLVFSTVKSYPKTLATSIGMTATPAFKMAGDKVVTVLPNEKGVSVEKFKGLGYEALNSGFSSFEINKSLGYEAARYESKWAGFPTKSYTDVPSKGKSGPSNHKTYNGRPNKEQAKTITTVKNHATGQLDFID